jgi:hypothetical protein
MVLRGVADGDELRTMKLDVLGAIAIQSLHTGRAGLIAPNA